MRKLPTLALMSGLALALTACGDSTDADDRVVDTDTPAAPEIQLTPIQEANLERLNRDEFVQNYMTLRDEMMAEGAEPIRPRSEMDFAYLDRNSDGSLDPAEYAIMRAPTDMSVANGLAAAETGSPTDSSAEAAMAPEGTYYTRDEMEDTLRSFFSLDNNGDQTLSEEEFGVISGEGEAAQEAEVPVQPE